MKNFIFILLLIPPVSFAFATDISTVEVFYSDKEDILEIDAELAHEHGLSITYYDLGAKAKIHRQISNNVYKEFKSSINRVSDTVNEEEYLQLSPEEQQNLVIQSYSKHKGNVKKLQNSLFSPEMRAKYQRAIDDTNYAQDHGIKTGDLPALLFNEKIYRQTNDINLVLDGIDDGR